MLQPSSRAAGSAAYRVQLQRVLQGTSARPRCQTALEVATASTRQPPRRSRGPAALVQPSHLRWFCVSRPARNIPDDAPSAAEPSPASTTRAESSSSSTPAPSSSSSDIPWYLKVDVPKHATLALQDQTLPEIPDGVPKLVKPLVSFVADDLGLDGLKLLDLRALDPPAALGPDLIMLFGSARSERHLHISADRLVRWLRKYGINATADGLLGRNELKIKLRRKARRAKLLGNMASLEAAASGGDTPVDDGISTQWVCVHAGTVGRARVEGASVDAEGRTSGFGGLRSTGTTVVVQMFTEAKRKQLDLESLWSSTLQRGVKKRTDNGEDVPEWAQAAAAAAREEKKAKDEEAARSPYPDGEDPFAVPIRTGTSSGGQQRRAFSTSARRLTAAQVDALAETAPPDIIADLTQPAIGTQDLERIGRQLQNSAKSKAVLLRELEAYVDGLSTSVIPSITRQSGHASGQSAFASACLLAFRNVPSADTWPIRARFYAKAVLAGDKTFNSAGVASLVGEMQRGGYAVDRSLYTLLLEALARPPYGAHENKAWQIDAGQYPTAKQDHEASLRAALSLLDTMFERGEDIIARDVLVHLIAGLARVNRVPTLPAAADAVLAEKVARAKAADFWGDDKSDAPIGYRTDLRSEYPAFEPVTTVDLDAQSNPPDTVPPVLRAADELQTRLEDLLRQAGLPCLEEAQIVYLLHAYAAASDWTRFWELWRMPAQHGRPRSEHLYASMFNCVANTNDKLRCTDALRQCVVEMQYESVPVRPVGHVLSSIVRCIAVADPKAESIYANLPPTIPLGDKKLRILATREFVKMLRTLHRQS